MRVPDRNKCDFEGGKERMKEDEGSHWRRTIKAAIPEREMLLLDRHVFTPKFSWPSATPPPPPSLPSRYPLST